MTWEHLPDAVRVTMSLLGDFRPTVDPAYREVKGVLYDAEGGGTVRAYLTATELREMAGHLIAVADWLDHRAAEAIGDAMRRMAGHEKAKP
jgi:hypothetical protein